jgi:ATP-dependent Clp protease ATP-binding subunit ClpA
MWQKFTEPARKVMLFSQQEASKDGELLVSTEHLLLGIIHERENVGSRVLERLGVNIDRMTSELHRIMLHRDSTGLKDMELTPRAKRVVELAYDEARLLGNDYLGTEHILLGLLREAEGLAGRVLSTFNVNLDEARTEITKIRKIGDIGSSGSSRQSNENATWERYSGKAKKVVFDAETEATSLGDNVLESAHILIALLREKGDAVNQIFEQIGVDSASLLKELVAQTSHDGVRTSLHLALSHQVVGILTHSSEEAKELGSDTVEPQHILLGILHINDAKLCELLAVHNITLAGVRSEVQKLQHQG